jgi:hypothetical protein
MNEGRILDLVEKIYIELQEAKNELKETRSELKETRSELKETKDDVRQIGIRMDSVDDRLPEFQLSSNVFDMFGKYYRGVSCNSIFPLSEDKLVVSELKVSSI